MPESFQEQQKKLIVEYEQSISKGNIKSTFVAMQKDYANDGQICLTSVVFVPENISDKINKEVIEPLRHYDPDQYFYPVESLHLTIKNIRTINNPPLFDAKDIEKVDKLFSEIIPQFSKFNFAVEDVVIFPTSMSVAAFSDRILWDLVSSLDKGLKEIGVPDNKKYTSNSVYFGNITLCRFTKKPNDKFVKEARKFRNYKIGKMKVEKINLITCNAVCYPKSLKIISEYKLR
ncbi:MAG: hypothetical protein PHP25_01905 [Candidatus Moranbacteria bacterium]|nr:hypothetical protein [Candidatus Moranbacteria bacterium]